MFNFFQHTDDFALYTEAIKFFNHSESMVRIAVRTLTLNVYKGNKYCIYNICDLSNGILQGVPAGRSLTSNIYRKVLI